MKVTQSDFESNEYELYYFNEINDNPNFIAFVVSLIAFEYNGEEEREFEDLQDA